MAREDHTPLTEPELPEEYEPEDLEMPDTYFENLYSADEVDSPLYHIWQGALYDNIKASTHVSEVDAMNVSRHLNKREIEEAEELTGELLEPETQE